jgi:hypothetical protein
MRLLAIYLGAIVALALPFAAAAQTVAPPGYHYEPGSSTLTPDDPCWLPAMTSPGAVATVNRSIGKPNGVPARVVSITDLASASPNSLASVGIELLSYGGDTGIACHAMLHFATGSEQSGVLSLYNPGEYATLKVQWIRDSKIASALSRVDRLRTSKNLNIVPDLKTTAIQVCVGRALALGASEQYPGQLWAACAQKNGSNLIPPTRASVNRFLDSCADKMIASPEYAWAMAHPEAKEPIGIAESGVIIDRVWPGSPADNRQRTIARSTTQKVEDIYQTEAIALASAYRTIYSQTMNNGLPGGDATAAALREVKADVRIWCQNAFKPGAFMNQ